MKQLRLPLFLMLGILFCSRIIMAQNTIQYALLQNTMDPLRLTAVAYPNFTSGNVTISTAVFTFYVPAGTVLNPAVPVLPSTGTFTDITGTWRIEKITPALYAMSGNPASDMQGNDIYQCVLQNSPSPVTTSGQPVQLFTFRVPSDCVGGAIQVHTNNNSIQQSLFNAFGININNQMSVSVNDAISTDIYTGNISNPALFNCPLDDVPDAVDDVVNINEDNSTMIDVTNNDDFGNNIPATGPISITTPPAFGTATVNDNGTPNDPTDDLINYTPPANFNGTVTVSYQICDADGDCDIATVTINVNAVNDAPDANPDTYTMNEDGVLTGNVSTNDTDPDGPMTNITVVTPPTNGMLTLNPDGTFTYTPNPNFNGTDTYTYSYCDGGTPNQCDQATVTITVGPVNDPPVANDDSQTTPEDMAATFSITANDTDVDGMINLASVDLNTGLAGIQTSVTVTGGTFTYNGDGTVTFTPNANFNGTATTDYQVCDTGTPTPVQCDVATITVTVNAVNDPPIANDDSQTTPEDMSTTFSITANDTDVDGTINLASVDLNTGVAGIQTSVTVTGGTFTYNGDGTVTFTPNANFNGTATTDYQVCDTGTPTPVQCDVATITVTVNAVNDPPVANDDSQTTPEDMATTFSITANDTDVDGTINLASVDLNTGVAGIQTSVTVTGGTFTYNGDGTVTFTPNANFNGTATTDYQVCDTGTPTPVQCDIATITVTVNGINDAPDANPDTYTMNEDGVLTGNVSTNDTDPDGPMTNITVVTPPTNGMLTLNPDGTFTYTPNPNFNGTDTYTYSYCDGGTPNQCDQATVTITVGPVNDPPVANDDSQTTPEDMAATFSITANDTDVDGMINLASVDLNTGLAGIQTSVTVTGGTFTYNGDGTVTFTPNANFNGTATTDYQVCDTGTPTPVQCDVATITVTVNAVNDPPVANDDSQTTPEDVAPTFSITANDTDVDGTINLASVDLNTTLPGIQTSVTVTGGTFTYNGDGTVTFTPNANFNGTATTDYQVCDTGTPTPVQCDIATITVTVNAVNDPPVANDDSQTTPEDMATTFSITGNDTDTDGTIDLASVDLNTGVAGIQTSVTVAGGTFTYNGNGTVTFTPNANFNGTATTDYQVCDTGTPTPVQCDVATITVTVNAINDPPIANDDSQTTPEDMSTTFSITANDTDVDGTIDLTSVDLNTGVAGIQTSVTVTGGTFTYNGNGTVTFTPNANFNGTATTDYQVCDTGTPTPVQCDVATITVTVNAVNDPPVANDDNQTTPEDMAATFGITANDTDTDGTINLASVDLNTGVAGIQTSVTVTGGTFTYNGDGTVTFTPNANFNGTATTDYQVCDTGTPTPVQCDVATITVTVNAVNDAPDAVNDVITINEDTSTPINVPANDTDVEGLNLGSVTIVTPPTNGMVSVNNMTGVVTYTPNPNFVGTDVFTYSICDNGTPILCDQATVTVTVNATSVRLLAKMRLQGALFGTNGMLMRDTLRQLNRLPATEPYTGMSGFVHFGNPGGETVGNTAVVFANNGANSIVDWVFVELRSMSNPATVVKTRAALLQRDGDVVDIDGTSALVFENTLPGNFYVAVRHRNHLGTMTAASVAMTNAGTTVDFTNLATPLWDDGTNLNGYEQATVAGAFALWAGNTNVDKSVVFAGQDNDKNTIFNQIDQAPGNSVLHSQLYVYNGYFTGDVNMDGSAIYAGQKNDVDFIFNNVDSHPRNVLRSQTYVIRQQLAE